MNRITKRLEKTALYNTIFNEYMDEYSDNQSYSSKVKDIILKCLEKWVYSDEFESLFEVEIQIGRDDRRIDIVVNPDSDEMVHLFIEYFDENNCFDELFLEKYKTEEFALEKEHNCDIISKIVHGWYLNDGELQSEIDKIIEFNIERMEESLSHDDNIPWGPGMGPKDFL